MFHNHVINPLNPNYSVKKFSRPGVKTAFIVLSVIPLLFLQSCKKPSNVLQSNGFTAEDAWASLMPEAAENSAAYMNLRNETGEEDTILEISSDVSKYVEIHEMVEVKGGMGMRLVENLTLRSGESVEFKPGAKHFMLIDLEKPLKDGETVALTIKMAKAGNVVFNLPLRTPAQYYKNQE